MAYRYRLTQLLQPSPKADARKLLRLLRANLAIIHITEPNNAGFSDTGLWIATQVLIVDDKPLPLSHSFQQP